MSWDTAVPLVEIFKDMFKDKNCPWLGQFMRNITKISKIAACIIGDEVLAGRTLDTNSNYLAKKCFEYGLNLAHIRVIPDDKLEIINSINELSANYSLVFTSGGIGPTHDDITYDSIAEAFNVPLVKHEPTIKNMFNHYKTEDLNKGQIRMATIPQADAVYETPGLWVPLVQTRNVLILPGVPLLFKRMVDNWFEKELIEFVRKGDLKVAPKMRVSVKTNWKESDIAEKLTNLQKSVQNLGISLGSYPKLFEDGSTFVIISISGALDVQDEIEKISKEILEYFEGELLRQ